MTDAPPPEPTPTPEPTPAPAASPPWTPPETFADRFSRWSTAAVRYSVAGLGLLSLVLGVLWLVPAIAVSTSDAYRIARERVTSDSTFTDYAGAPIVCDRVPAWYRVGGPDGDLFRFDARGPAATLQLEVRVKDGQALVENAFIRIEQSHD